MEFRRKIALWLCPELSGCCVQAAQDEPQLTRPEIKQSLIGLAETYSTHTGLTLATISSYAVDDGKFFKRLKGKSSCTLRTAESVLEWFSDRWPNADLAWPSDIPRPQKSTKNRRAA